MSNDLSQWPRGLQRCW